MNKRFICRGFFLLLFLNGYFLTAQTVAKTGRINEPAPEDLTDIAVARSGHLYGLGKSKKVYRTLVLADSLFSPWQLVTALPATAKHIAMAGDRFYYTDGGIIWNVDNWNDVLTRNAPLAKRLTGNVGTAFDFFGGDSISSSRKFLGIIRGADSSFLRSDEEGKAGSWKTNSSMSLKWQSGGMSRKGLYGLTPRGIWAKFTGRAMQQVLRLNMYPFTLLTVTTLEAGEQDVVIFGENRRFEYLIVSY